MIRGEFKNKNFQYFSLSLSLSLSLYVDIIDPGHHVCEETDSNLLPLICCSMALDTEKRLDIVCKKLKICQEKNQQGNKNVAHHEEHAACQENRARWRCTLPLLSLKEALLRFSGTDRVPNDESTNHARRNSRKDINVEGCVDVKKTRSAKKCLSSTHFDDFSEKLRRNQPTASHIFEKKQKLQKNLTVDSRQNARQLKKTSEQDVESTRSKVTDNNGCIVYKCKECGKILSTSYNLLIHQNIHTGARPYICPTCDKNFRSASGLNRHVHNVHDGIKNFACDVCGRRLASKASRDEHRRTHTGERPYRCETCGKSFKQKASLHVHRLCHSQILPHRCDLCERAFRRKQELEKHLSWHSDRKPYACDVCNERFRSRGCVVRHRRTHTDQRSHICEICSAGFSQERYLKKHCGSVHGIVHKQT
nr:PREDICTED: zinc finger protein OZF-like [Linepithema humile]